MTRVPDSKRVVTAAALALGLSGSLAPAHSAVAETPANATIILVHGAFEDSSVWNGVVPGLKRAGYTVVAAADPLRSLRTDAGYVSDLVASIAGPVVLVGHSYGGSVITDAAVGHANVAALVYVAALAPDAGESAFDIVGRFPGSILGASLKPPVALSDGAHDLYVRPDKFADALASDLPAAEVDLLAGAERPVTDVALKDPSRTAAWKSVPALFIYGTADRSIPANAYRFMAHRARAKHVVAIAGASHLVMLSHPEAVEHLIEAAAASPAHQPTPVASDQEALP